MLTGNKLIKTFKENAELDKFISNDAQKISSKIKTILGLETIIVTNK